MAFEVGYKSGVQWNAAYITNVRSVKFDHSLDELDVTTLGGTAASVLSRAFIMGLGVARCTIEAIRDDAATVQDAIRADHIARTSRVLDIDVDHSGGSFAYNIRVTAYCSKVESSISVDKEVMDTYTFVGTGDVLLA